MAVNCQDYDFHFDLAFRHIVAPDAMPGALAAVAAAHWPRSAASTCPAKSQLGCRMGRQSSTIRTAPELPKQLAEHGAQASIVLGSTALRHVDFSALRAIAQWLATESGATLGLLPDANSAAGWIAGAVPQRLANGVAAPVCGRHAAAMLEKSLGAYMTFGIDPKLDCLDGAAASAALQSANFVVSFSAFRLRPGSRQRSVADRHVCRNRTEPMSTVRVGYKTRPRRLRPPGKRGLDGRY